MNVGTVISRSGHKVIITEQGVEHMAAHPIEDHLIREAIANIAFPPDKKFYAGCYDFGRLVGFEGRKSMSPITPDQPALFARRNGRKRPSRTVIAQAQPIPYITVCVRKGRDEGMRFFVSAWCGTPAAAEPTSMRDESNLDYWCKNALIYRDDTFVEEPFESTWREVLTTHWQKLP